MDDLSDIDPREPLSYCPPDRVELLYRYSDLLADLNRRLNLVSRETVADRWTRHVLHSLCLAYRAFPPGARVVDWGTGGGLPLLPLAIAFPKVRFTGVDALQKRVLAVRTMIRRLGLDNATAVHARAGSWEGMAEFSVSRATAPLAELWGWHRRVASQPAGISPGGWPAGLMCLKGGDLRDEITATAERYPGTRVETLPLADIMSIPEFTQKCIVIVTEEEA